MFYNLHFSERSILTRRQPTIRKASVLLMQLSRGEEPIPKAIAQGCRPRATVSRPCSKLGRQIAVDLEANAHFDECRSCP
jgi:hypothetical protein